MPKVSLVIPVYNTSKYLLRCLDSVRMQTLKDIEVIIVNDGSTDKFHSYIVKNIGNNSIRLSKNIRPIADYWKNFKYSYDYLSGFEDAIKRWKIPIDKIDAYKDNILAEKIFQYIFYPINIKKLSYADSVLINNEITPIFLKCKNKYIKNTKIKYFHRMMSVLGEDLTLSALSLFKRFGSI